MQPSSLLHAPSVVYAAVHLEPHDTPFHAQEESSPHLFWGRAVQRTMQRLKLLSQWQLSLAEQSASPAV